jgi:ribosomal 30S subunit maturation factor RimM
LGTVIRYFEAGSQGVCEVSTGEGTFLFPVTREVLREVEAPDRVVINLLPNLMEVNL